MAWNYKKSKPVKIEESKVITDPRSETSLRGKSKLAVGNKQAVSGSGAARKQKDVTWV
jgi:hypothetical protein